MGNFEKSLCFESIPTGLAAFPYKSLKVFLKEQKTDYVVQTLDSLYLSWKNSVSEFQCACFNVFAANPERVFALLAYAQLVISAIKRLVHHARKRAVTFSPDALARFETAVAPLKQFQTKNVKTTKLSTSEACPVCLDAMTSAVLPLCRHAVCEGCYLRMQNYSSLSSVCVICRRPLLVL